MSLPKQDHLLPNFHRSKAESWLDEALTDGRLSEAEFFERSRILNEARTFGQADKVLADLPASLLPTKNTQKVKASNLLLSNEKRQQAIAFLTQALTDGRLDEETFEVRSRAIEAARTFGQANMHLEDLPAKIRSGLSDTDITKSSTSTATITKSSSVTVSNDMVDAIAGLTGLAVFGAMVFGGCAFMYERLVQDPNTTNQAASSQVQALQTVNKDIQQLMKANPKDSLKDIAVKYNAQHHTFKIVKEDIQKENDVILYKNDGDDDGWSQDNAYGLQIKQGTAAYKWWPDSKVSAYLDADGPDDNSPELTDNSYKILQTK